MNHIKTIAFRTRSENSFAYYLIGRRQSVVPILSIKNTEGSLSNEKAINMIIFLPAQTLQAARIEQPMLIYL